MAPRLGDADLRPTGAPVEFSPCALVETARLATRPLTLADVPIWLEFLAGAGSLDYLPFVEATRDGAVWWIERQMGRYERDGHGLMALLLKPAGEFVGQAGLLTQHTERGAELEIGYHLLPRWRGQGLATEAATAFKECLFARGRAEDAVSIIHVDNRASQRVAVRNGMSADYLTGIYTQPHLVWRVRRREQPGRSEGSSR